MTGPEATRSEALRRRRAPVEQEFVLVLVVVLQAAVVVVVVEVEVVGSGNRILICPEVESLVTEPMPGPVRVIFEDEERLGALR